jgi:hypothetical protein
MGGHRRRRCKALPLLVSRRRAIVLGLVLAVFSVPLTSTATPPSPPPPSVAVVFRGEYFRHLRDKCSDYLYVDASAHGHTTMVLDALVAAGSRPSVYFHTVRHPSCRRADEALVSRLNATGRLRSFHFSGTRPSQQTESNIRALHLVSQDAERNGHAVDAVVLTRFDLQYREPITAPGLVDWTKVNFPWRDKKDLWWEFHMVSDLQIIFPFKWVKAVVNGLRESARVNHERCRVFDHKNCSTESPGHFAYNSIYRDVGKNGVKFVQSIFGGSHVERPEAGRYIWINRTCAGAHEDERVYKYAGDILAQGPQSRTATTTTRKEKARHSKDLSALLNPTRIWGASKQPKGERSWPRTMATCADYVRKEAPCWRWREDSGSVEKFCGSRDAGSYRNPEEIREKLT